MSLVRYEGRKVTKQWYNRYVLRKATSWDIAKAVTASKKRYEPAIHALFHMPEIVGAGDCGETRLIRINGWQQREWLMDMQNGYAELKHGLTTFFPSLVQP